MPSSPPDLMQQTQTDAQHTKADILKKLSRRNWLRDSVLTATGAVLLPSFLTGCTKEDWDKIRGHAPDGGGLGEEAPLTQDDLKAAAKNINLMRVLLADVYNTAYKYDEEVFKALNSTVENGDWTNFIVDIFIDIGVGISNAVGLGPSVSLLFAILKDWGIGKDRPANLNGFFAEYQFGQIAMAKAIDEKLAEMVDVGDNYANLRTWKDPILFNGNSYTLKDLANEQFPDKEEHGVAYYKIYNAMYLHHKRSVWNLAIIKCCDYEWHYGAYTEIDGTAVEYGRNTFYSDPLYAGAYLRGYKTDQGDYWFTYWYLGINKNPFPPAAIRELFMDDTPGHIINPNGLFNRSYVFQQFSMTKPDFSNGHELANDVSLDFNDAADDWVFTGGLFSPERLK